MFRIEAIDKSNDVVTVAGYEINLKYSSEIGTDNGLNRSHRQTKLRCNSCWIRDNVAMYILLIL